MIQSVENYYNQFLLEEISQTKSLTNFIDFIIVNESRFVNIYELQNIIKYFVEHNNHNTGVDFVTENYLYGDVNYRLKYINFQLLFDELENLIDIRNRFADELKYATNPEDIFNEKDIEQNLDILFYQLEFLSCNLSKYSFKRYFLYTKYSKLLNNKESQIKKKFVRVILRTDSNQNLEELAKKLLFIVLLEINKSNEPVEDRTFTEVYQEILLIHTSALIKIEKAAEDWFKEFKKRMVKEFSNNFLEEQKLIAKDTTTKMMKDKISSYAYDLIFDLISLSKFDSYLQLQNNLEYLQLKQNNPIEENIKNYVYENCYSPFCIDELRDFVEIQMNGSLMLLNEINKI